MPGTDGIELVRKLARRKVALPVVLISGHADVPMAVAGIKSGAEDFIEKPVDDAQLVAAINRAFARTFERQHLQKSQADVGRNFARLTPRQVETSTLCFNERPAVGSIPDSGTQNRWPSDYCYHFCYPTRRHGAERAGTEARW